MTSANPARETHDGHLSVQQEMAGLRDTFRHSLHDTADSGKRVISAVGSATASTARGLQHSALDARDKAASCISQRPFTSVAIAMGIGALLGAGLMWRRR